jgi:TonB family protein
MRFRWTAGLLALSGLLQVSSAVAQSVPAAPDQAPANPAPAAKPPAIPFGAEAKLTDHKAFHPTEELPKPEMRTPEERCKASKQDEDAGIRIGLGVEFQPYVDRLQRITNASWKPLIPKEADAPVRKKGVVEVCFTLLPSGQVEPKSMILVGRSGDDALDRAAWGAIQNSVYPPMPKEFKGPDAVILLHFAYNTENHQDPLHNLPKPPQLPGPGTFTVGYTSKL